MVFITAYLTFNNILHHLDVHFLNRFVERHGNRCTTVFSECNVAAAATGRLHLIPIAFKDFLKFA